MWRRVVAIGVLSAAMACSREPDVDRCTQLRDHVVELRLKSVDGQDRAVIEAHRRALAQALGDKFLDGCKTLTADQLKCGLSASESSAVAACGAPSQSK